MPAEVAPHSKCKRCNAELTAEALVCKRCHALVHAEDLEQMAGSARELEAKFDFAQAREIWLKALPLLPPDSKQSEWVLAECKRLEDAALSPVQKSASHPSNPWLTRFAPLAAIAFFLTKGKALLAIFNAKFLFSLGAFLGVYWSLYGLKFGLGFTAQLLIHELGHYIDIRRRGLPADMPVFLPGLGAYVRWQAIGVPVETRAAVSLAGPLAGWFASAVCAWLWFQTGDGLWAALARTGAWLNVLNLIPVWALDGGQAFLALDKAQRVIVLGVCLLLLVSIGEGVFLLVALGAGYRLFTKDLPNKPSFSSTAYFVAVLAGLAVIKWLVPGEGFGAP